MKFRSALLIGFLLCGINAYQQDYFIIDDKDTTKCVDLEYSLTVQGWLKRVSYTTLDGEKVEIDGRKEVPNVTTFCIDSVTFDRTPLNPKKPEKYIRYDLRTVDGKIKVYAPGQRINTNGDPVGKYRFFVRFPDGEWYTVNSKNMETIIKPYLIKCKAFASSYSGEFSTSEEEAIEMFELYNQLCQE
ncbi:MAG: hypothetical protein HUJ25_03925 [Crocinitomicaceae bacterium]|nr:hypothetical protein [Crocinitomicaceae bacterium]